MRSISDEFSARLATGVTTLAHVWRITRRDGAVFGFTDHDRPLALDALVCEPSVGLRAGAIEKSLGLGVDTASFAGALASEAIAEVDIARGLWDGALVELFRVDWTDPSLRVHLFAGRLGEVRRGASAFEAELRGLQAELNRPVGRVFSRHCDATLGDTRCGKDIETSAFRGDGVVSRLISSHAFAATGLADFATGWFSRGRVLWSDGASAEIATHALGDDEAVFEFLDAPGVSFQLGANFVVYAGCDKRLATCRAKFANSANFRGFPHMPGNDVVQAGPVAGEPMDGGSRYS
jgi:uncharacterized phage protein (TIGR02218 family)